MARPQSRATRDPWPRCSHLYEPYLKAKVAARLKWGKARKSHAQNEVDAIYYLWNRLPSRASQLQRGGWPEAPSCMRLRLSLRPFVEQLGGKTLRLPENSPTRM